MKKFQLNPQKYLFISQLLGVSSLVPYVYVLIFNGYLFFDNFVMAYPYLRGRESYGNIRFMIERQGVYDDGPQSSAICNQLNQLNHEQQMEISQEEVAGSLQTGQEEHWPMVEEQYYPSSNIEIEKFFSFVDSSPIIDSEPPIKIPHRQEEELSSIEQQFEIASIEDSGGTTIFHPLSAEEHISPEIQSVQQHSQDRNPPQSKDKSYNKNLACYISRSVRRLIFGKFKHSTSMHCKRRGLDYGKFELFCSDSKFSGINSIRSFYSSSGSITDNKMGELFRHLYQKILRRSYLRTVIEEGKMTNIEAYIEYKNKYLLNLE